MKGKTLKLACLAGMVFLLFLLPSCSLFDLVSGIWDGEMSIDIDFQDYGTESSDVNMQVTITKNGSLIVGELNEADDFAAPFLTYTYAWDIPGDVSGTASGRDVTFTVETETSYVNVNYQTVTITVSATFTGTVDGSIMTGTVEGSFDFSGGYTNTYDFDGTFRLMKID